MTWCGRVLTSASRMGASTSWTTSPTWCWWCSPWRCSGVPLKKWTIYNEPAHASVYTPPDSPDAARVRESYMAMGMDLYANLVEIRENPRPGMVDALARLRIEVRSRRHRADRNAQPAHRGWIRHHHRSDRACVGMAFGASGRTQRLGGDRAALLDLATEEFLRFFTPPPATGAPWPTTWSSDG